MANLLDFGLMGLVASKLIDVQVQYVGWTIFGSFQPESLILAQNERWRQA